MNLYTELDLDKHFADRDYYEPFVKKDIARKIGNKIVAKMQE